MLTSEDTMRKHMLFQNHPNYSSQEWHILPQSICSSPRIETRHASRIFKEARRKCRTKQFFCPISSLQPFIIQDSIFYFSIDCAIKFYFINLISLLVLFDLTLHVLNATLIMLTERCWCLSDINRHLVHFKKVQNG